MIHLRRGALFSCRKSIRVQSLLSSPLRGCNTSYCKLFSVANSIQSRENTVQDDAKWIKLMQKTSELETSILLPLNEKVLGPLDRKNSDEKLPALPIVFLLGNHSSGKSTFINYLLHRDVQTTGVAPTDDGFTIIAPGTHDIDQDGPALVGDPDLGFSGLRSYGPALIQRTQLKVRQDIQTNFMLVDSPGMIDSPKNMHLYNSQYGNPTSLYRSSSSSDRGYEFPEVVRWYAERADVILLFFDPDKPGTTGETLSILTSSLIGMDHKLHIVLNKVDQFTKIHDFARAYGSLCWNLSKVIPLKDLPRIYTMCLPVKTEASTLSNAQPRPLGASLKDLEAMRDEVVSEVHRAPERRVDNLITNLYDASRLLSMHATILEDLRSQYAREKNQRNIMAGLTFVTGQAIALGTFNFGGGMLEVAGGISAISLLITAGMMYHNHTIVSSLQKSLVDDKSLNDTFRKRYGRQLAEGDEYVVSLWKRVLPSVQVAIATLGLSGLPKVKASELNAMDRIVTTDVPTLRREMAPSTTSLAHKVAKIIRG